MTGPGIDHRDGVVHLTSPHQILSRETLTEIACAVDSLAVSGAPPLVFTSAHPTIFLAGAHLAEIAELDADSCDGYARFGRQVIARFEEYPGPTVAAVDGVCAGGGLDFALAFDTIVAGPLASFAHPGVGRGLVTGWGGTSSLPASVSRPQARSAILAGRHLSGHALDEGGIVRCRSSSQVLGEAVGEARRLRGLNPARITTWRSLKRGDFIDRFRVSMILNQ